MTGILAQIGRTALVPLPRIGAGLPVPVLAKCEHLNPGGSVKDRIALAIVDDAEARGVLRPGMTLVEATAGNTGMGLALVAAARRYDLVCVMPEKMSVDGWFLTDQFNNPANLRVHEETTAQEILEQTGGRVGVLADPLGSGIGDGPVVTVLPDGWDRYRTQPWMLA